MIQPFIIIADGACSKNPGPGGYGTIVVAPAGVVSDSEQVFEFGGSEESTTNNRMEIMGYYRGLKEIFKMVAKLPQLKTVETKKIHVILDSKYVIDGAQKYIWSWSKNGWKTAAGGEVKNQDLWQSMLKGLTTLRGLGFMIEYEQVKGHSGHEANERVDQISVAYCKAALSESQRINPIDLYSGPLKNYSVKIVKGENNSVKSKPRAESLEPTETFTPVYLSYLGGELLRHTNWTDCEKFVRGKPGVRYKKVTNQRQEDEVLQAWGVELAQK